MNRLIREYIQTVLLSEASCSVPKVVFLAGAPGSGKSRVISQLRLDADFKIINPDDYYESMLRSECIPLDTNMIMTKYKELKSDYQDAVDNNDVEKIKDLSPEYEKLKSILSKNMKLFNKARSIAKMEKEECCQNMENYIVDGTGGNIREITKQVTQAKEKGFDVAMIYVNVPLETSIKRDESRGKSGGRSLGPSIIRRSWSAVVKNRPAYESMFGKNFFYIEDSADISLAEPVIRSFIDT